MAWVRQYSAPNVVGARKLKAFIFYTINPLYTKNGHFAFWAPLWGLRGNVRCSFGLIGKTVMDFLLVIIEPFSLGTIVQALRANIDWKLPFLNGMGHIGPNFQVAGDVPHQLFVHA